MKQRRAHTIPAFLLIVIGVVLVALGIGAYTLPVSIRQNVVQQKDLGLVPYIPNFENLTIEDLPNFSDVRMVAPYKDRKIVMGYGLIIDVDASGKLYRINAPEFNCAFSAVVVGTSLYTTCNETEKMQFTPDGQIVSSVSTVVRIDLDSGKIEERLDMNALTGVQHVNLKLESKGDDLWGGSRAGAFRYNTTSKQMTFFPSEIIFAGKQARCFDIGHIAIENDMPVVFSQNCEVISSFDASAQAWSSKDVANELPKRLNLTLKDFGLTLPAYGAISPIVNGKRYVFASDGVYALKKDGFPEKKLAMDLEVLAQDNAFVDPDEKYAIAISNAFGGPRMDVPALWEGLEVYLITLADGIKTELMSTFPGKNDPATAYNGTIEELWKEIQFAKEGDIVRVMNDTGEEALLVIDVAKKSLLSVLEQSE